MENENSHKGFSQSIKSLVQKFGPTEKILFYLFTAIFIISGLAILSNINNRFLVEVPAKGGTLREGLVGSPRFINPILAIGENDKTIDTLIYSGLLKPLADGSYTTDLAEEYSISEDGLIYDVKLRSNAKFHDGKPITADDVIFTINKALDPVIKSQMKSNWEGVSIDKISEQEITFTLKKPYSPFLENLTMGILPKHIWENIPSEEFAFSKWNLEPIGSGPYKVSNIVKDSNGIVTTINLKSFKDYYPEEVKISNIAIKFFPNIKSLTDSYRSGSLDSASFTNTSDVAGLKNAGNTEFTPTLPRIFGTFFNQNKAPVFSNIEVRRALDISIDKQALVDNVLNGYGIALSGPTPQNKWQNSKDGVILNPEERVSEALALLTTNGWKPNADGILEKKSKTNTYTLKFTISTSDSPDLKNTAEILAGTWRKLGAEIDIKVYDANDLNVSAIKPRNYEVLLFGEVIGRETDLYPFWHSSERNDPGLNISLYANITVDKLLEEERQTTNQEQKTMKITAVDSEIEKDVPAVFLYSPKYIYLVSNKVKNIQNSEIQSLSERFMSIEGWYINTNKVWKIFQNI